MFDYSARLSSDFIRRTSQINIFVLSILLSFVHVVFQFIIVGIIFAAENKIFTVDKENYRLLDSLASGFVSSIFETSIMYLSYKTIIGKNGIVIYCLFVAILAGMTHLPINTVRFTTASIGFAALGAQFYVLCKYRSINSAFISTVWTHLTYNYIITFYIFENT